MPHPALRYKVRIKNPKYYTNQVFPVLKYTLDFDDPRCVITFLIGKREVTVDIWDVIIIESGVDKPNRFLAPGSSFMRVAQLLGFTQSQIQVWYNLDLTKWKSTNKIDLRDLIRKPVVIKVKKKNVVPSNHSVESKNQVGRNPKAGRAKS